MAGDYGIKVSKPGEDVLSTANKNLVYNSGFNSLKIHSSGNVTATGTPTDVSHSLGYEPAFLAYSYDVSHDSGYILSMGLGVAGIEAVIDSSKLRFTGTANGDKVAYFIMYDPADTSFTEFTGTKSSDYGIKVSQDGEDVFSSSDTNQSFYSSFNTLQIRDVYSTAGPTAGNTVTVSHNYGYPPAFLCQLKRNIGGTDSYQPMPYWEVLGGIVIYCESQTNDFVLYAIGADFDDDVINIFAFTEALE